MGNDKPTIIPLNWSKDQKIVYAPEDTYTNESIQTFTEIFNRIADAMSK